MTVNVAQPVVTIAPGHTGTVTLDAQRMIDGPDVPDGYAVSATSTDAGITVAPTPVRFGSGGSATASVPITVAQSVPEDYYLVYLTSAAGESARRSTVLVVTQAESGSP